MQKIIQVTLHAIFGVVIWVSGLISFGAFVMAGASYLLDRPFELFLMVGIYAAVVFAVAAISAFINMIILIFTS